MEKGDLVMLKEWCKDTGRTAIITEVPPDFECVKILFLDIFEIGIALKTNVILLEAK